MAQYGRGRTFDPVGKEKLRQMQSAYYQQSSPRPQV